MTVTPRDVVPEKASAEDAAALAARFAGRRVLVLGDAMVDATVRGACRRLAPDAPIPVLEVGARASARRRPGGAAAVAGLCQGLGAEVRLAALVGRDADGAFLRRLFATTDMRLTIDPRRPTTRKTRYLTHSPTAPARGGFIPLLRVDRESTDPPTPAVEDELRKAVAALLPWAEAVLISDYGKGACTPRIVGEAVDWCRRHGTPALVDPARGVDWNRYAGAACLKANDDEHRLYEAAHGGSWRGCVDRLVVTRG
ncbi:MAG: bifunctional heptose 7-phosphate kinase/heptose 1-phosphate adenyltransferase, partial [Planctomycetia bacterium]